MKGFLITSVIVLFLALAGAAYYGLTLMNDRNDLQSELAVTQATLTATQQELSNTQTELASTKTTLEATQGELATTTANLDETSDQLSQTETTLASTKTTLQETQSNLSTTEAELAGTKTELQDARADLIVAKAEASAAKATSTSLQRDLDAAEADLSTATDTLSGLGITLLDSRLCYDVALVDNPAAQDPTWAELKAFLQQDQTEMHEYILNEYDCSQFSRDLHNRAEAAGIRAAEVQIDLKNETAGHALDAFLTTDYGLVYIDCTQPPDTVGRIEKDAAYRASAVVGFYPANARNDTWWNNLYTYYYIADSGGNEAVVARIIIYW